MALSPSSVFAGLLVAVLSLRLPALAPTVSSRPALDACSAAERCADRLESSIQNYSLALGAAVSVDLLLAAAIAVLCCLRRRPADTARRGAVDAGSRPEGLETAARYLGDIDSYKPPVPRRR